MDLSGLKIIVIDCAYDVISDIKIQHLFSEMINLKIQGYKSEYPYGVLPVDATDYIGTHLLVVDENSHENPIIMGVKSITLDRCNIHRLDFPAYGLVDDDQDKGHLSSMKNIIEQANNNGETVAYNGGWTIHPEVRKNRELLNILKDLNFCLMYFYYRDYKIPHVFAGGTHRFNVPDKHKRMGFENLQLNGEDLPPVTIKHFFNEKVTVQYMNQFSEEIIGKGKKFESLWQKRLTFSHNKDSKIAA